MRRRTDVDGSLSPVLMPGRILEELSSHALEGKLEECCGLIVGDDRERYQRLVRCRNEMTQRHERDPLRYPRDGTEAFYMNEHDYQRAQEEAEAEGLRVTAVYHSHVGGAAYLSTMDLEFAESEWFPFPDAEHIVISLSNGAVSELGLFSRRGLDDVFRGRSLKALLP